MNVSITKRDFDKAVKQPWNINSCVLAQTAKRIKLYRGGDPDVWAIAENLDARTLMETFDIAHHWKPNKRTLTKLRASLPMKITV